MQTFEMTKIIFWDRKNLEWAHLEWAHLKCTRVAVIVAHLERAHLDYNKSAFEVYLKLKKKLFCEMEEIWNNYLL